MLGVPDGRELAVWEGEEDGLAADGRELAVSEGEKDGLGDLVGNSLKLGAPDGELGGSPEDTGVCD